MRSMHGDLFSVIGGICERMKSLYEEVVEKALKMEHSPRASALPRVNELLHAVSYPFGEVRSILAFAYPYRLAHVTSYLRVRRVPLSTRDHLQV
jgi:hypothetical protein